MQFYAKYTILATQRGAMAQWSPQNTPLLQPPFAKSLRNLPQNLRVYITKKIQGFPASPPQQKPSFALDGDLNDPQPLSLY